MSPRQALAYFLVLPARLLGKHLRDVLDQRQLCKVCGQTQEVDFVVSDQAWSQVVPPRWDGRVVCLSCFEVMATRQGVATLRVFLPGGP